MDVQRAKGYVASIQENMIMMIMMIWKLLYHEKYGSSYHYEQVALMVVVIL